MKAFLSDARKAVVALVGAGAALLTEGLVTGTAAKWLTAGVAAATVLGVYVVPNSKQGVIHDNKPSPPVT